MNSIKQTTDRAACVNTSVRWIPFTEQMPPLGAKVQLINEADRSAMYGTLAPADLQSGRFTHWQACPTFAPTCGAPCEWPPAEVRAGMVPREMLDDALAVAARYRATADDFARLSQTTGKLLEEIANDADLMRVALVMCVASLRAQVPLPPEVLPLVAPWLHGRAPTLGSHAEKTPRQSLMEGMAAAVRFGG